MTAAAQTDRLALAETALEDGRAADALALTDALLASGEDRVPVWRIRIRALQALGDPRAVRLAAGAAVARHPTSALLAVDLGKACLALGEDATALAEFERGLVRDPLLLEGWKGLLTLRPVLPDEDGLDRVAASITDARRSARLRAKAAFVLGQILTEAGRHDEGFARYAEANAIVAEGAAPGDLEYRYPPATFAIDRRLMDRHRRPVTEPCPAILISGLPRSGKSLAEGLISAAEGVRAGDELAVLARFGRTLRWSAGVDAVVTELLGEPASPVAALYAPELQGAARVTDTGPTNLFRLGLLGLLHPDVPVILCRRDPLDLGASMFFKQFRRGNLFTASLPALGRAMARAEWLMDHWVATLPNPVLTLRYEDMVTDPQGAAARLAALTGLAIPAPAPRDPQAMRLTPGRSLGRDGISPELVGFAAPFARHLAPMMAAHAAERDRLAQ